MTLFSCSFEAICAQFLLYDSVKDLCRTSDGDAGSHKALSQRAQVPFQSIHGAFEDQRNAML